MWSRENLADMLFVFRMRKTGLSHGDKRALREPGAVDKHIQKNEICFVCYF